MTIFSCATMRRQAVRRPRRSFHRRTRAGSREIAIEIGRRCDASRRQHAGEHGWTPRRRERTRHRERRGGRCRSRAPGGGDLGRDIVTPEAVRDPLFQTRAARVPEHCVARIVSEDRDRAEPTATSASRAGAAHDRSIWSNRHRRKATTTRPAPIASSSAASRFAGSGRAGAPRARPARRRCRRSRTCISARAGAVMRRHAARRNHKLLAGGWPRIAPRGLADAHAAASGSRTSPPPGGRIRTVRQANAQWLIRYRSGRVRRKAGALASCAKIASGTGATERDAVVGEVRIEG